jgi:hypothetical protein
MRESIDVQKVLGRTEGMGKSSGIDANVYDKEEYRR